MYSLHWRVIFITAVFLTLAVAVAVQTLRPNQANQPPLLSPADPLSVLPNAGSSTAKLHPVHINRPIGSPVVLTGDVDLHGQPVSVSCSTCHSLRQPDVNTRTAEALDEFHQGLTYNHGSLTCVSCHNTDNYDELRLADQSTLPYTQVMSLCGQCHGPQFRDYKHGAHGGMTGYWDLSAGPRSRNNCIDCHDPHAPAFPKMMPTFKPYDRFLTGHSGDESDE